MYDNSQFQELVTAGNSTGEVVGIERFLVRVKGLNGTPIGAVVLFESGQRGIVREINTSSVLVLNLDSEAASIGSLVVIEDLELSAFVGDGLIGRVVTPLGHPLDGKGPVQYADKRPVFATAPGILERKLLNDQLVSGVSMVDTLFPVVLGQRIAVLGDTKSGKTSFLLQMAANQTEPDRIVVYVLIGKRRAEIDQTIKTLQDTGAMAHSIVVVASIFDSLAQSYIAPYVGCAIAEYLWQRDKDVVIVYDDLSSHAKVYREISLLAQVSPGRDSYPGDMFFAHSSLLERAGKLASNDKTLTALPVIMTPGDDITAYLPTSIMSITDGQIIFDLATFRENIKPAINTGLSVSRVGGRAQSPPEQALTDTIFRSLAAYRQALEFSHFGSDLSAESQQSLRLGQQLYAAFGQNPNTLYTRGEQQLLLRTVAAGRGERMLNIDSLKTQVKTIAAGVTSDEAMSSMAQQLLESVVIESSV